MTYEEAINFLYNATPQFQQIGAAAYKPGLDTTIALDNAFGNPHHMFMTIHVGGTNGKGSVSHTLASILQEQGYKTGLYTSPHLVDFRERIRVNGEKISHAAVIDFLERYQALDLGFSPSFFELTTIMAFDYFKAQNVDIAVIEVGLGGRLDCTNIISPILSVITNISKDHTAQLGNTLESIAEEKAGIIKPNVPAVIGEAEGLIRREVFEKKATSVAAPILFAQDEMLINSIESHPTSIAYNTIYGRIISPLAGIYQQKNMQTILATIKLLSETKLHLTDKSVANGISNVIKNTHLTGRWMTLASTPTIIADTGHNIGGWEYLSTQLLEICNNETLRIIIGFVSDKDVDSILHLMPRHAIYYLTQASVKRAMDVETLANKFAAGGIYGKRFSSVESAIKAAIEDSNQKGTIFIGGSTFVVADAIDFFSIDV